MAGTKDRILDSSAELFRRQGYTGTGVKQIAAAAKAPFGSLYHFFPGGKEQLGEEVIRWSGGMYLQLFVTVVGEVDDPVAGVEHFFAGAAETLEETDYEDACPIATVALEVASTNEQLRIATADVFDSWIAAGTAYFAAAGIAEPRARELTLHFLSALEGAFVFSRAKRSTEPMHVAGAAVAAAVREELASG
jgi:AcrR family transcriptional regulator